MAARCFLEILQNAHNQSAHSQRTTEGVGEIEVTCAGGLSAAARCLCAGDDAHTEEAEFCPAQGGQGAVDEWPGSDCLYPGRGAQFAGALDRARARRAREGFAWSALSYCARNARRTGRGRSAARSFQVRSQAA